MQAELVASQIISLMGDERYHDACAVIDEVVRGDHARDVLAYVAGRAVLGLRLLAEPAGLTIESLLVLSLDGPDGDES